MNQCDSPTVPVADISLETLKAQFLGELIGPNDPAYDSSRKVWNGLVNRCPAVIAMCSGVADVIAAVKFAREQDLLVAVRAGGHNVAGTAVCDDGIVIDLSRMKGIRVDPFARNAWAEPGLLLGEFDHNTQVFGLATTGGIVTHTGLAGLTLGGGLGWLMRKHGLTCDNLLSADIVTATGEFLRASEQENSDLFWGIRGGGGNFGIVTAFEFQLQPVGPEILAGPVVYPATQAEQVLKRYRDFISSAPDELGTVVTMRYAPAAPWLPEHVHGQPVVMVAVCYAGSIEEAEKVVAPLRALGDPLADVIRPTTYCANQGMYDAAVPHGLNYYWKSHYLESLSDDAIQTLIEYAWQIQSPLSYTIMFHMGGAVQRKDDAMTAFSGRDAQFAININGVWTPESGEDHEDIEWTREMWAALVPYSTGKVYMNFLGDEGLDRVKAAYGLEKYQRLVEIKNRYDPTNFFRMNHNIKPSP